MIKPGGLTDGPDWRHHPRSELSRIVPSGRRGTSPVTASAALPLPVAIDRAVGVVVASAAGDALGAGYEFGPPISSDTPVAMVGGGAFGWAPGEWTDDTQMALCILSSLAGGSADPGAVEEAFRAWYRSNPADVGNQTRAVLGATGPLPVVAARYAADHPNSSSGNGSLMRTGPVALAHPGDPAAIAGFAREVSGLTHAEQDCIDACVLWSVAIDHTIHHAPPSDQPWDASDELRTALDHLDSTRRARWAALIDEAASNEPGVFTRNGWVVHAFQAALAAVCATPVPAGPEAGLHLVRSLENAVRVGGDTDTVAAIAGSLLGARWGSTAVPVAWRRILGGRGATAEPAFRVADLDRLARLAYGGGRPGAQGWPGCPTMIGHYRDHFSSNPVIKELGGVWFGNAAAVPQAIADGADVVISLCRMGTDDVPGSVEHHVLNLLDTTPEENPNLVLLIADAVDTIAEMVSDRRRVFVHCVAAENRTPTLAAAWLCRHGGLTAGQALTVVARELNEPKPFLRDAVRSL